MPAPVGVNKLFQALWLHEVEGMPVDDACAEAGIARSTYYLHRQKRSDDWQQAEKLVAAAIGDLKQPALRRARRILATGMDGPAAMLIVRILGLSERQDHHVEHAGPIPIAIVGDGKLAELAEGDTGGAGEAGPDTGAPEAT